MRRPRVHGPAGDVGFPPGRAAAWPLALAVLAVILVLGRPDPALADPATPPPPVLREAGLTAMMHLVEAYYEETRNAEGEILSLLLKYEKGKDASEYKKLRFLFDAHQKVVTSLNNLLDVLYIYVKIGNAQDRDVNNYVYYRSRNIITFLNNLVYVLAAKNQEIGLSDSLDVQVLYDRYLSRLTALLYELNKGLAALH